MEADCLWNQSSHVDADVVHSIRGQIGSAPLGVILGLLGAVLGRYVCNLGPSRGSLGAILGPLEASLGLSWGHFGASWGHLGIILNPMILILIPWSEAARFPGLPLLGFASSWGIAGRALGEPQGLLPLMAGALVRGAGLLASQPRPCLSQVSLHIVSPRLSPQASLHRRRRRTS